MRHTLIHHKDSEWIIGQELTSFSSQDLLIFFCGWASDYNTVKLLLENNCFSNYFGEKGGNSNFPDMLVCYDYAFGADCNGTDTTLLSMPLISDIYGKYRSISLIAWSLGVWAANNTIETRKLDSTGTLKECVAINGTLYPADNEYGIPVGIFKGTLEGLNERNLYKFRWRMCGGRQGYETFMSLPPERDLDSDIKELKFIFEASTAIDRTERTASETSLKWTKAVIGNADMIFPSKNQETAWKRWRKESGKSLIIKNIDSPHFGLELFR